MEPVTPSESSHRLRIAAVVLAAIAGVALVVGGVWLAFGRHEGAARQSGIEPAQVTTATPTPGAEPSASPTPTATGSGTATPVPGAAGSGFVRAPKLAFRIGTTVYVANEDGTGSVPVARNSEGPYALSPDGATLAVVNNSTLEVYDVATGASAQAGPAEAAAPVWAPDSARVLFLRPAKGAAGLFDVWQVGRDGSGAKKLQQGLAASFSPDGKVLVVRPNDGGAAWTPTMPGRVFVSVDGGAFETVEVGKGFVTAAAACDDALLVALAGPDGRTAIVRSKLDGSDEKSVAGPPTGDAMATWSGLLVSPDCSRVIATAAGDDGYSRISVLPTFGGAAVPLSLRRDGYPLAWSADGTRVLFIEGNSVQGESTALMSAGYDGTGERTVVTGAEP